MRVRTLILSAIVAFSTSGCLIEDFDDGVIDEARWQRIVEGSGPSVAEADGVLRVTLPATSRDDPAAHRFGGGYLSRCVLRTLCGRKFDGSGSPFTRYRVVEGVCSDCTANATSFCHAQDRRFTDAKWGQRDPANGAFCL